MNHSFLALEGRRKYFNKSIHLLVLSLLKKIFCPFVKVKIAAHLCPDALMASPPIFWMERTGSSKNDEGRSSMMSPLTHIPFGLFKSPSKILDCTLEGDLERPKGIWVTAQKTSSSEEWGKLPPLRMVKGDDRWMKKWERRIDRWKGWFQK